jgi:hypothetical protein
MTSSTKHHNKLNPQGDENDSAVFMTAQDGEIVYANSSALNLFARMGFDGLKNICQINVFRQIFAIGLQNIPQDIEWIADRKSHVFNLDPDPDTNLIRFTQLKDSN